jgi:DNA-directed RNA polymerase subunit beta'
MNKQSFTSIYLNRCFDKSTLKGLVRWSLVTKGENFTILLLEKLKTLGYSYATKAGISLSLDDLMIPATKKDFLNQAQYSIEETKFQYDRGNLTVVERFQHLMDTWHLTSERLKTEVVNNFVTTNTLNPVYMMAFSGARGNLSQVRQLVGMRGLMSDPQGQIINFPIQSNFREGLTVTEYVISCYGARKGLVDTALRTANSGYLTRRLVDVAQHVIVSQIDCETEEGIALTNMIEANKTILTLEQRLIGRVLSQDYLPISTKNTEITPVLAEKLGKKFQSVSVRSPLTCEAKQGVCQLCYGWSLANGKTVALGEAVGVIAAQSIGEPGTQLTMRTFHTGGVFSGESMEQIFASTSGKLVYESTIPGVLIRTSHGKIAFLTRETGTGYIQSKESNAESFNSEKLQSISFPPFSILFLRNGENVEKGSLLAEFSSISKQANERIQTKQTLTSDLEGQVWFEKVVLGIKNNREGKLTKLAHNYGSLWILAGKVIPVTFGGTLGVLTGDKLTKNASLNESFLTVPENGYLFQSSKTRKSLVNKMGSFLIRNTRFNNGSYWFRKQENLLCLHDRLEIPNSCIVESSNLSAFSWYPFLQKGISNSVHISSFISNLVVAEKKNSIEMSKEEISTSVTQKIEELVLNKLNKNILFEKFPESSFVIPVVPTLSPNIPTD